MRRCLTRRIRAFSVKEISKDLNQAEDACPLRSSPLADPQLSQSILAEQKGRTMNPLIQLKQTTSVFLIAFGLACFGLLPLVRAVSPTPDGCFPNFTTAEGCDALQSLTTGAGNTAIGWRSIFSSSIGSFNTGVGAGALVLNTADSNTAVGTAALLLNTTGTENTAIGTAALLNNTTGGNNTANGFQALSLNTTGENNAAVGAFALLN